MDDETYETTQGETWDDIALELYGDEAHADWLMQNNFWCLDVLVFPSGMILNAPPLPASESWEGGEPEEGTDEEEDPYAAAEEDEEEV